MRRAGLSQPMLCQVVTGIPSPDYTSSVGSGADQISQELRALSVR